jgi:membrane protein implicated in regulation of membrane protease activity
MHAHAWAAWAQWVVAAVAAVAAVIALRQLIELRKTREKVAQPNVVVFTDLKARTEFENPG